MIICDRYHSTKDFTYNKDTKCFVTEASDFQEEFEDRVYDDAADVGFVLISQWTDKRMLFVQDSVDEIGGEITGWRYKPAYLWVESKPIGKWTKVNSPLSALIIND